MKTFRMLPGLLLAILIAGCNLSTSSNPAPAPAQAWIDAPRDGMQLPLQPYTLIFHGSDQAGVKDMEVSVDGSVLTTLANPNPGNLLIHLNYDWKPAGAGQHLISVRARNTSGVWGQPASVTVMIGIVTPPTNTPTLTLTPTATRTRHSTRTPTETDTPTPAFVFGSPSLSVPSLYYGTACHPNQVNINLHVSGGVNISTLTFFFKQTQISSGKTTDWSSGQAMLPDGSGGYTLTVTGDTLNAGAWFDSSQVSYQFVAQLGSGDLIRSDIYDDLILNDCIVPNG